MSNQDDGLPKIGEVWHLGSNGDGTCARWRCTNINPATNHNSRQFVFRALDRDSDKLNMAVMPQAVFESDIMAGRTDLHGPESDDDADMLSMLDKAVSFLGGRRMKMQPIAVPAGVDSDHMAELMTLLLHDWLPLLTSEGLDAVKGRIGALSLNGWQHPARGAAEQIVEARAEGYTKGLSEGDSAGYDRGRSIGRLEADKERALHPYAPAWEVMCNSSASVIVTVLDAKHGMTHRAIAIDLGEERGGGRRHKGTGPLDDQRVRAILRDVMIPADAAAIDGLLKTFPKDWESLLADAKGTAYSNGEHDGIAAGEKAALALAERSPTFELEEVLRGDLERPRVVVIGRDFESWCVLTRMHGVPEVGGTYSRHGDMAPAIAQGALTEVLSTFDPALAATLAGWPGGLLNSIGSIPGNSRPIGKHPGLGMGYGPRETPPVTSHPWTGEPAGDKPVTSVAEAQMRLTLRDERQSEADRPMIPAGVYYNESAASFYDSETFCGCGNDFAARWMDYRGYFPQAGRTIGRMKNDAEPVSHHQGDPGLRLYNALADGLRLYNALADALAASGAAEGSILANRIHEAVLSVMPGYPQAKRETPPVDVNYGGHGKPGVDELRAAVRLLVRYSHGNSLASGWWPELLPTMGGQRVGRNSVGGQRNAGELLCLIHSEISEALEGYRKDKDDEHLPHFKSITVELADGLHRIFDLAGAMRLSLAEAYAEKGEYNLTREDHKPENRAKAGGKTF